MACIYKITDLRENLFYIGKHKGQFTDNYFSSGIIINNIKKKHGIEKLKRELIVEGDFNPYLLNELEKHYIRLFNTKQPFGYNLTDGGDGNNNYSPEVLRKIGDGNRGKKKHTEEFKELASIRRIKYNKERVTTDEIRKKMSDFAKSRVGQNHPRYDSTFYNFIHLDGRVFRGTRYEFEDLSRIKKGALCCLIKGTKKSYKGWFLDNYKINNNTLLKKPHINTEDLYRDYISGISLSKISRKYKINISTVRKRLTKFKSIIFGKRD